ncbi:MAG: SCO family protein [Nitrospirae bacterium]|nr:SCO family protein [Nitrospirota bacterium]
MNEAKQTTPQIKKGLYLVVILLLIIAALLFVKDFRRSSGFKTATVLDVPVPLPYFTLLDHNGNEFGRFSIVRKWTFAFFGYTNCPDICPTALVDMNGIYNILTKRSELDNTQFVFVSVDPHRDTAGRMKEYVTYFNKDFIGVTGSEEAIAAISAPLGVAYSRRPAVAGGDYMIDHSASFLLIDPLGRLRAIFIPPHSPEEIAEDFLRIRKKYAEECCIIR